MRLLSLLLFLQLLRISSLSVTLPAPYSLPPVPPTAHSSVSKLKLLYRTQNYIKIVTPNDKSNKFDEVLKLLNSSGFEPIYPLQKNALDSLVPLPLVPQYHNLLILPPPQSAEFNKKVLMFFRGYSDCGKFCQCTTNSNRSNSEHTEHCEYSLQLFKEEWSARRLNFYRPLFCRVRREDLNVLFQRWRGEFGGK